VASFCSAISAEFTGLSENVANPQSGLSSMRLAEDDVDRVLKVVLEVCYRYGSQLYAFTEESVPEIIAVSRNTDS
jgi:hypothetical protein